MRNRSLFTSVSITLLVFATALLVSCKPDECEDVICPPCPSSRFVVEYQDSLGNCVTSLQSNARIYGLRGGDTVYNYGFTDSCLAGFLVQENLEYHVVATNPALMDVIVIDSFGFQPGVENTTCCLCYPVSTIKASINSDQATINFPDSMYENTPYVRVIN